MITSPCIHFDYEHKYGIYTLYGKNNSSVASQSMHVFL